MLNRDVRHPSSLTEQIQEFLAIEDDIDGQ